MKNKKIIRKQVMIIKRLYFQNLVNISKSIIFNYPNMSLEYTDILNVGIFELAKRTTDDEKILDEKYVLSFFKNIIRNYCKEFLKSNHNVMNKRAYLFEESASDDYERRNELSDYLKKTEINLLKDIFLKNIPIEELTRKYDLSKENILKKVKSLKNTIKENIIVV